MVRGTVDPVVMTVARREAVNAIKRQLQAKGIKVVHVERTSISSAARDYLRDHPELIDKAAEIVRDNPQLRTISERYKRKRTT